MLSILLRNEPRNETTTGRERLRSAALVAVLVAAIVVFGVVVHRHYPLQKWFLWRLLGCWLICGVFSFACFAAGFALCRRLLGSLPSGERFVSSLAIGLYAFALGWVVGGLLGVLGRAFALAWPLALCAVGVAPISKHAIRWARRWTWLRGRRRASGRITTPPTRIIGFAATVFGTGALALIYFTLLTPANMGFDAAWYHLPIAERYAAEGAIRPFPEGSYLAAYPHLASILYSWAFLFVSSEPFNRVLLAAHLEFAIFLWTLASIPVLVRRLVPGSRPGWAWATVFLFPGILLYDSGLCLEADHVLAFFAIPIYLAFLRVRSRPCWRGCVGFAVPLAGALLTKYSGILLFVGPATSLLCVFAMRTYRAHRRRLAGRDEDGPTRREMAFGATALVLATAILTAWHWLKNWVWYGDPVYPFLAHQFPLHPWTQGAAAAFERVNAASGPWRPEGSLAARLLETLRALVTFSFEPHDWPTYHGSVPVFGSLFTLLLFTAPFLRGARRAMELSWFALVGVFVWYWRCHQDRYLQAVLPWMVGAAAALIVLLWRRGGFERLAVAGLVVLQVSWGGDVYFIPAADDHYEQSRASPLHAAADLVAAGYRKEYEQRFREHIPLWSLRQLVPREARVLFHERYLVFGLGVPVTTDLPGWQGGIGYADHGSAASVADLLSRMRITHIAWESAISHEQDSLSGDLRFFDFLVRCTGDASQAGAFSLAPIVSCRPAHEPSGRAVLLAECSDEVPQGVYDLEDVGRALEHGGGDPLPWPGRGTSDAHLEEDLDTVSFAVINRDCHRRADATQMGWRWFRRGPYDIGIGASSAAPADVAPRTAKIVPAEGSAVVERRSVR